MNDLEFIEKQIDKNWELRVESEDKLEESQEKLEEVWKASIKFYIQVLEENCKELEILESIKKKLIAWNSISKCFDLVGGDTVFLNVDKIVEVSNHEEVVEALRNE